MKKLLAMVALALASTAATANVIPLLTADPTDNGNGTYTFTYSAGLAADQAIRPNDFFTLYDVQGFVSVASLPTGWRVFTQNLGQTPGQVTPNDDPNILNVTFRYNGKGINYPKTGQGVATELGTFTIISTLGGVVLDDFASQGTKNAGIGKGTKVANIGSVGVPGPVSTAVPEPTIWGLMLAGFGLIGLASRRRNIQVVAS